MEKIKQFFRDLKTVIVAHWNAYQEKRAWLEAFTEERFWSAVSPSATVPLGMCDYDAAMLRAARLGPIGYTDMENALIFVSLPGHSGIEPPDYSGN